MKKILLLVLILLQAFINAAEVASNPLLKVSKRTDLMYAVIANDAQLVEKLIKSGANVNTKDVQGQTALHWAINMMVNKEGEEGDEKSRIINLLLNSSGININQPDDNGLTPLMLAIINQDKTLVDQLIKQKANINEDRSFSGRKNVINYLSELIKKDLLNNVPIDQVTNKLRNFKKEGLTPLMLAIRTGNINIVKSLLEAGANAHDKIFEVDETGNIIKESDLTTIILKNKPDIEKLILSKRVSASGICSAGYGGFVLRGWGGGWNSKFGYGGWY